MLRSPRCIVLFALGLGACNNATATITGVTPSTAVSVDPVDFIGDVKCGTDPGDMQLYVATIVDRSPTAVLHIGSNELVIPSAPPAPCSVAVLFENVLVGREYSASVDGYDRSDIAPLAPGSRIMVVRGTGEYAKPRWQTRCGQFRLPPSLRTKDGGLSPEAGQLEYADSGLQPDGGYLECSPLVLYGPTATPWLGGPVCAETQETIPVRGCEPLAE